METYEVRFLQEAFDDLEEIILYIAEGSPAAALRMHDEIVEKANSLSTFPRRGRYVPDVKMRKSGYRMLIIRSFIIFYRIVDNNVFIYKVVHGAANYPLLYEKMTQKTEL